MKKLLMVANVDWFFISHRLCIAKEAKKKGWEVFVAAENTGRANEIINEGITFIDIKFSRSGINPFEELLTLYKFRKLYKEINEYVKNEKWGKIETFDFDNIVKNIKKSKEIEL